MINKVDANVGFNGVWSSMLEKSEKKLVNLNSKVAENSEIYNLKEQVKQMKQIDETVKKYGLSEDKFEGMLQDSYIKMNEGRIDAQNLPPAFILIDTAKNVLAQFSGTR